MIELRPYQEEAVTRFLNKKVGLLEMATGTGKTITALSCVQQQWESDNRQFLVIMVPQIHLIPQWTEQFSNFGIPSPLVIAKDKNQWLARLKKAVWYYTHHFTQRVVLIGSYQSLIKPECQQELAKLREDDCTFLLADECHNIGQSQYVDSQFKTFQYRLGLSATPERWRDEIGTEQVLDYFNERIYQYPMDKAIQNHYLTPYEYHPVLVDMTSPEIKEYQALSKKIRRLMFKKENEDIEEQLTHLLMKRSRLLKKAENKIPELIDLLSEQSEIKHTLVYCAEGEDQIIVDELISLGITAQRFTSEISFAEREIILEQFSAGKIDVLVAIKCLDEGVDIPATKTAYFLASTTNPREFIQRRGRILRKFPNKTKAVIYDFIILPLTTDDDWLFKNVAQKEMPRFAEFSKYALNQYASRKEIYPILKKFSLELYLDLLPHEMLAEIEREFMEQQDD